MHAGTGGRRREMGSISRYIFRTTFGAFLIVLVSLTTLIWVTQALRDFDLMTNQGQTIVVFVGITGLIIPLLILVIAPIALLIAVAHVLNKLSTDSEIIVMNAAIRPSASRCWRRSASSSTTTRAPSSFCRTASCSATRSLSAIRPWWC